MTYDVRVHPQVKDDLSSLDPPIRDRIKTRINNRLIKKPKYFGEPLRGTLKGLWKFRVGDYRVVYRIEAEDDVVSLLAVSHRKNAYQRVRRRLE